MEHDHDDTSFSAVCLEGEGSLEPDAPDDTTLADIPLRKHEIAPTYFYAPLPTVANTSSARQTFVPPVRQIPQSTVRRLHEAWSTAVNSRLGRADNARFLEHFRYIIVASQLLNEYFDHGGLQPSLLHSYGLDGGADSSILPTVATTLYGALATAAVAFALVYLIHRARSDRYGTWSKSRIIFVLAVVVMLAVIGYAYARRQWLKLLRRQAVAAVSNLTANWQALEVALSSTLSLIQEVELVSKGYRLSTPLPPVSRMDDQRTARRCGRLRKVLHTAYAAIIPMCIESYDRLRSFVDVDDLEKYFEVYDISGEDATTASTFADLSIGEEDSETLRSLRALSYQLTVLRRIILCSLMALEADGGKPDFHRWRTATEIMQNMDAVVSTSTEKLRRVLSEAETIPLPATPMKASHTPAREKIRSQVRKISTLSSGIRGLQAKMQVLREETNRSIEQSEDLNDLGPSLMAQYDAIGADLKDLMQAWESGKTALQSNITKQEQRISMASSSAQSNLSLSGLTAVDEGGSPADALKVLSGESLSNRSSMATSPMPSDEEVFEAVAMPRRRNTMTREERIAKMQEERERQATLRATRDANTSMLRELESVISLRPRKDRPTSTRVTSL